MDQETKQEFEQLAKAIKEGFEGVDRRFDSVDSRFDKVEGRLDKVEDRLDKVEVKIDNLEATLRTQYPDKTYLDNKLGETVSDIVQRIMKRDEKDRDFKLSLIELLKRHSLLSEAELEKLRALVV